MYKFVIKIIVRFIYFVFAIILLILGILGLFLPVLPGLVLLFAGFALISPCKSKRFFSFLKTYYYRRKERK